MNEPMESAERNTPTLPSDDEIDFSDIPPIRDWSKAMSRGEFFAHLRSKRETLRKQQDGLLNQTEQRTAASTGKPDLGPGFRAWFGKSIVKDRKGNPLVVYRGEHGASSEEFHSRSPSLSFGGQETASQYAMEPNDRKDVSHSPRVMPCYLRIEKPLMNDPDDPFLDFGVVVDALGSDRAIHYAVKHSGFVIETNIWEEQFSDEWPTVEKLLAAHPEQITELYMLAFPLLDDHDFVRELQAKGYDGAIHGEYGMHEGEAEYKVFSPNQVKSALGNSGTFDPANRSITASPENLRAWLGDSKVTVPVYHGTTHDFANFDAKHANEENYYGPAFYFTDSKEDAGGNYAGEGPDLTQRIERRAEEIEDELLTKAEEDDPEYEMPGWNTPERNEIRQRANEQARSEIKGQHGGMVMPCYLKIRKPITIGPKGSPSFQMIYDEATGDERGSAMRLWKALLSMSDVGQEIWGRAMEKIGDYSDFTAFEFEKAVREDETLIDDDIKAGTLLGKLWQKMGYDGIIMDAHAAFGKFMKGISQGDKHYIVFRPTQIKSAIGNSGNFNPRSKSLVAGRPVRKAKLLTPIA